MASAAAGVSEVPPLKYQNKTQHHAIFTKMKLLNYKIYSSLLDTTHLLYYHLHFIFHFDVIYLAIGIPMEPPDSFKYCPMTDVREREKKLDLWQVAILN